MNNLVSRRTFLKLGTAAVGTLTLTKYAEPLEFLEDSNDWIQDKGDFFIVRVPDFKTFAREQLDKPTIFILGQEAGLMDVSVNGYANVHAPRSGTIVGCFFDATKDVTENSRPVLNLGGCKYLSVTGCTFKPSRMLESVISLDMQPMLTMKFSHPV